MSDPLPTREAVMNRTIIIAVVAAVVVVILIAIFTNII